MTGLQVLDIIGRYAGIGVTTLVASGVGAFIGSYLKKKGENLATHEDIDKLTDQVTAVTTTTKQIEAAISNEMWRRERKAEAQLKTIDAVNTLTTNFLQQAIADRHYRPDIEWFSAFGVADAAVKALFDEEAYKAFKSLEVLIGEPTVGEIMGAWQFAETRNTALKVLYAQVFDY